GRRRGGVGRGAGNTALAGAAGKAREGPGLPGGPVRGAREQGQALHEAQCRRRRGARERAGSRTAARHLKCRPEIVERRTSAKGAPPCLTTTPSSSAPVRAATSPPSGPPSWA